MNCDPAPGMIDVHISHTRFNVARPGEFFFSFPHKMASLCKTALWVLGFLSLLYIIPIFLYTSNTLYCRCHWPDVPPHVNIAKFFVPLSLHWTFKVLAILLQSLVVT